MAAEHVVDTIDDIKEIIGEKGFAEITAGILDNRYIKPDAHGNRVIEAYWDYRDVAVLGEVITDLTADLDGSLKEPQEVRDFLIHALNERAIAEDWFGEMERGSYQEVIDNVRDALYNSFGIDSDYVEYADWQECLQDDFHVIFENGITEHVDDVELKVNLLFGIGDEWNREYSSIPTVKDRLWEETAAAQTTAGYPHGDLESIFDDLDVEYFENNSATWLIHSQGYTLEDVFIGEESTPFLDSIRDEFANLTSSTARLVCCATVSFNAFCELHAENGASYAVGSPGAHEHFISGFFDKMNGGGSVLGVELERPLVINHSVISEIQVEDARGGYGYTVGETYGFASDAWSHCLDATDEPVSGIPKVDFQRLASAFRAIHAQTASLGDPAIVGREMTESMAARNANALDGHISPPVLAPAPSLG